MTKEEIWEELEFNVKNCKKCKLCNSRKNVVFEDGNRNAKIMFITEAPGEEEDNYGKPFAEKAGKLLDKVLSSAELTREDIYITNIVKCKPPRNRIPDEVELLNCRDYLEAQIALVSPKLIVTVGNTATQCIIDPEQYKKISKIRGEIFDYIAGIKLMPIFHPKYLLRSPSVKDGSPKWHTWKDMIKIKDFLDKN